MTADIRDRLRKLTEAHAAATGDGEWRVMDLDDCPGPHSREILDDEGSVAICSGDNDQTGNTVGADRAAAIVAEHNATPWLVAALTAVLDLADDAQYRPIRPAEIRAVVAAAGDQP